LDGKTEQGRRAMGSPVARRSNATLAASLLDDAPVSGWGGTGAQLRILDLFN